MPIQQLLLGVITSYTEITATLIASPTDLTTDVATYSFTNLDTSSVTVNDRLVAVIQSGETTATATSVTIGGITANIDAQTNTDMKTVFASITNFSGATATVGVTFSTSQARCRCSLVRLTGNYPISFFDSGSATAASGTGLTMTDMNIPAYGLALVGDYHGTQGTPTTYTVGGVTILRDGDIEANSYASLGRIPYSIDARTAHTVTTLHSNSSQSITLVGASYGY